MNTTDPLREYAHILPESGQDLVALIGLDAAISLVNACGGSTFPVPHGKNSDGAKRLAFLTSICGEASAKKLSLRYGGTRLYIPNCKDTLRRVRNICMIKEYTARLEAGETANSIIADLAPRYKLADRNIWDIVNKTTVEEWSQQSGSSQGGQLRLM